MWSAVGHIIGLGDRHSENILIDTSMRVYDGRCTYRDMFSSRVVFYRRFARRVATRRVSCETV